MVDHVVWDWNGTLLADVDAVVEASRAGLAAAGRPQELDLERYRSTFRRPLRAFYEELVGEPVGPVEWDALGTAFARHYDEAEPHLPLSDGALAALERLDDAGVTQSLLSLHADTELRATLARRDLLDRFVRVDGDRRRDGGGKATALAEHLDALGRSPADVVLIGDTVDDALATAAVGTGCVLVTEHSTHHEADLCAVEPTVPVVTTLGEAVDRVLGPAS